MRRRQEYRRPQRHMARIDGDAAPGAQGHTQRTDRACVRCGQLAEEHIARVRVQQFIQAMRVGFGPALDAIHRRLLERQFPLRHQPAPDRLVGVAVLVRIADAHSLAVRQLDAARALYLEEEQFDRVIGP